MKPTVLAVLPARGGSKRIPRKNVVDFHGQPMISWPIQAIKASGIADAIIVSTDSAEIRAVAEKYGAQVPFERPPHLSGDFVGTAEVTRHALEWFVNTHGKPQYVLTVYPTAVFVSAEDIASALTLIEREGTDMVFSAAEFPAPVQRALFIDDKGIARMFQPENYLRRSQDLVPAYHDAGQFYLVRTDVALQGLSFNERPASLYIMPRDRVIDIDTPEDLRLAEKLFEDFRKGGRTRN
jgi:N-acylneuraminate cytidylyltransferase